MRPAHRRRTATTTHPRSPCTRRQDPYRWSTPPSPSPAPVASSLEPLCEREQPVAPRIDDVARGTRDGSSRTRGLAREERRRRPCPAPPALRRLDALHHRGLADGRVQERTERRRLGIEARLAR